MVGTGGGLRVVDVTDTADPVAVGAYDAPGFGRGVAVSGTLAYVADVSMAVRFISVANPTYPSEVTSYNTVGGSYDVVLSGTVALVADGAGGLVLLDASNVISGRNLVLWTRRETARPLCYRVRSPTWLMV